MGHHINVLIDDIVWMELQRVPKGERSRLISEAVSKELQHRRRSHSAAEMDRLRKTRRRTTVSTEDLVRVDRDAHW